MVVEIPVWAMVHLTHAALQSLADEHGVELLHIKGPATSLTLRDGIHDSTDADILVRPAHLAAFQRALESANWRLHTDFDEGSPFGHAANYVHPNWTYADVHRTIPGPRANATAVFNRLWEDRVVVEIAHRPCTVLSLEAQVLIQVLHSARSHGYEPADAWRLCPTERRGSVRGLADDLDAATAFAAGIGELDAHRDRDDHALWSYFSQPGDDRLGEWRARWRSTPGVQDRFRLLVHAVRVNRTHLRLRLDREPSAADVAREQWHRIGRLFVGFGPYLRGRRAR